METFIEYRNKPLNEMVLSQLIYVFGQLSDHDQEQVINNCKDDILDVYIKLNYYDNMSESGKKLNNMIINSKRLMDMTKNLTDDKYEFMLSYGETLNMMYNTKLDDIIIKISFEYVIDDIYVYKYDEIIVKEIINKIEMVVGTFGYKGSDSIKIYDILLKLSNKSVILEYLNNLNISSLNLSRWSIHLLISDNFVNDNYLNDMIEKNDILLICYEFSSYKMVKRILIKKGLYGNMLLGKDIDDDERHKIVLYGLKNTDDRVFNLVYKLLNESEIKYAISNICYSPNKYYFRKLKMLNKKFDMKKYFGELLCGKFPGKISDGWKRLKVLISNYESNVKLEFIKFNFLSILFGDETSNVIEKYNWLKTNCSSSLFKLIRLYYIKNMYSEFFDIYLNMLDLVDIDNMGEFINGLIYSIQFPSEKGLVVGKILNRLKNMYGNKFYDKLLTLGYNYMLHVYGNYIPVNSNSSDKSFKLKINKIKTFLRVNMNRHVNRKYKSIYGRKSVMLNELLTYRPNKKYSVLCDGSEMYRKLTQGYYQIKNPVMYNPSKLSSKINYVTLKADGVNETKMNMLTTYRIEKMIKSEYIEDKKLYLVYDINDSDMTYMERVIYLRRLHSLKLEDMYEAKNIDELIKIFVKESRMESEWLNKNKGKYCWYPKAFVKYRGNMLDLSRYVFEDRMKLELEYGIDGLILNNGGVDYKIKPKGMHTIDVEYKEGKFHSKNGVCKYKIENVDVELEDNMIYRCYPSYSEGDKYVVGEIRYDKYVANSDDIIESIRNSYNSFSKRYYDDKKGLDESDLMNVSISKKKTNKFLLELNLDKSKGILDLGCGKGDLVNVLKDFGSYTLIDVDTSNVRDKNRLKNVNVMSMNLCESKIDRKYGDKIWVMINSFWYFSDNVLREIERLKPKELVFNVHSKNVKWESKKSYMRKVGNDILYYYNWCHNEEHIEKYLNIDMISGKLRGIGYRMVKSKIFQSKNNLWSNFEYYYYVL